MKDRLFNNYSIFAMLITISCLALVYLGKVTLQEVSIALPAIIYLFWKKDNNGSAGTIAASLVLLLLVGCQRNPQTSHTETSITDTTIITERIVHDTLTVPGDSVLIKIPCLEADTKPFEAVVHKSKNGRAKAVVTKPHKGELQIQCVCDSEQVVNNRLQREILKLRRERTKQIIPVVTHEPRWYDIACRWLAGIFILLIVFGLILKFPIK